jgi:hypothetical protein
VASIHLSLRPWPSSPVIIARPRNALVGAATGGTLRRSNGDAEAHRWWPRTSSSGKGLPKDKLDRAVALQDADCPFARCEAPCSTAPAC